MQLRGLFSWYEHYVVKSIDKNIMFLLFAANHDIQNCLMKTFKMVVEKHGKKRGEIRIFD